jgi:hypothetical protein
VTAPRPAPVVVVVDGAGRTAGDGAVRWAAREAVRLGRPLRILLPAGGDPRRRRAGLVRALAAASRAAPALSVSTALGDEPPGRAARVAAADAALLVVPGGPGPADDLGGAVRCPLVVVPPGGSGDAGPPVPVPAGAAADPRA